MHSDTERPLVMVVDDNEANIDILVEVLGDDYELSVAMMGEKALELAAETPPDLILLDIMMPEMDGYEVCRRLKADYKTARIPVIFVTAMSEVSDETRGFEVGAVDYITKPISPSVVLARVAAHLALANQQLSCEKTVEQQVAEIKQAQRDAIFMLGQASHFNDDDTGVHIWRMACYAQALAQAANWPVEQQALLQLAAPMHDTGKIGIPDSVLKKPGKLNADEWDIMRTHSMIGYDILSVSKAPVFRMAAEIARNHHERWDGKGYPENLKGAEIPESARIVAIADVFDALTMRRPYKEPWPLDKAFAYIEQSEGHFEPRLAALFLSIRGMIEEIMAFWEKKKDVEDVCL